MTHHDKRWRLVEHLLWTLTCIKPSEILKSVSYTRHRTRWRMWQAASWCILWTVSICHHCSDWRTTHSSQWAWKILRHHKPLSRAMRATHRQIWGCRVAWLGTGYWIVILYKESNTGVKHTETSEHSAKVMDKNPALMLGKNNGFRLTTCCGDDCALTWTWSND